MPNSFVYPTILISNDEPSRIFFFIFLGLLITGLLRALNKTLNIPIPFRVFPLFIGAIISVLIKVIGVNASYIEIANVPPRYLLMACMPILMFKTAFCIDSHIFTRSWGQVLFVAAPGTIISSCLTGMVMMVLLNYKNWTYAMGLLFGTICSSVYPVEIVALLKDVGQGKHLSILLEGEGMIGDGTVIIMCEILLGIIEGSITKWYHGLMVFTRFALGGVALGWVYGKLAKLLMAFLYTDAINLFVYTVISAYLIYYLAVEVLYVSGVIAVIVLGIMINMEKTSLSNDVETFLLYLWDILAYITDTIVFLSAGFIIAERVAVYNTLQGYAFVLVTYIVVIVVRLLEYTLLAPIVSRTGYGLTFKNMLIAVWGGLRGPVAFLLTLRIYHQKDLYFLGEILFIHVVGLVVLTLLINATFTPLILKMLGLSELSMARKVNMNNCMRHLQNRRDRTISMLKMDRFLSDANWALVYTETVLKHPYKINYDSDEEEDNYLGFRVTVCPDCQKEIPNEPTNKEMSEMIREARLRILKAKKMSYARQYENGMLSKEGIRILTQAVEVAMDTPEARIELDGLFKYFKKQGFMHFIRQRLFAVFKKTDSNIQPPRKHSRKICYNIIMHPAFDIFINTVIVLNIIPIGLELGKSPRSGTSLSTWLKVANTIFFLIYLLEFILKIYGYSWIYVFQHGFKTYFKSYWNIFDFLILLVCAVDLTLDYVDLFSNRFNKSDTNASKIIVATRLLRVVRLVRLIRICRSCYPKLIEYCDSKIDKHLAFAYDVGKGFVTGEEEVSEMLIQMIDNKTIREDCRLRMEADRLAVTKELGMVQKDRPWIAITVKTKQAIRTTLNGMAEAVFELKVSGWVDDFEYQAIMESLEEKLKYVRTKIKSVQPSPPKTIFKEVPWMADDEEIAEFLYENIVTKMFDPGDVVCAVDEMSDGIYIIVTGLLKLKYIPKKEILNGLAEYGSLPIIDYISSTRFDEKTEDYIVSGNCIGELSALTGRPYNCTVTADTACQVYILTHEMIKRAFGKSSDPICGLEAKMWKCISIRLATSILMDTPAYQALTQDKIRFQLERAFVPNLSNYKVFAVNDMMEDIILIDGVAFDYNTKDCYIAPCYIPRTVQKIMLPKSSQINIDTTIETKLLIVPAQDVDEFDIMEREDMSEMVSTASMRCLQHTVQSRSSRLKRRKRLTTFNTRRRRVKYHDSVMSGSQSRSIYYSRSHLTEASSLDRESENRNITNTYINNLAHVINERSRQQSQDRRISRVYGRSRRSLKESPNLDTASDKRRSTDTKYTAKNADNNVKEKEDSLLDFMLMEKPKLSVPVRNSRMEKLELPQRASCNTYTGTDMSSKAAGITVEDILTKGRASKLRDSIPLKGYMDDYRRITSQEIGPILLRRSTYEQLLNLEDYKVDKARKSQNLTIACPEEKEKVLQNVTDNQLDIVDRKNDEEDNLNNRNNDNDLNNKMSNGKQITSYLEQKGNTESFQNKEHSDIKRVSQREDFNLRNLTKTAAEGYVNSETSNGNQKRRSSSSIKDPERNIQPIPSFNRENKYSRQHSLDEQKRRNSTMSENNENKSVVLNKDMVQSHPGALLSKESKYSKEEKRVSTDSANPGRKNKYDEAFREKPEKLIKKNESNEEQLQQLFSAKKGYEYKPDDLKQNIEITKREWNTILSNKDEEKLLPSTSVRKESDYDTQSNFKANLEIIRKERKSNSSDRSVDNSLPGTSTRKESRQPKRNSLNEQKRRSTAEVEGKRKSTEENNLNYPNDLQSDTEIKGPYD